MTEAVSQPKPEEFVSRRTLVGRRFVRNRSAVCALVMLVALAIGCYALPPLLPYSYTDLDFSALQTPPSPQPSARTCWPRCCAGRRSRC